MKLSGKGPIALAIILGLATAAISTFALLRFQSTTTEAQPTASPSAPPAADSAAISAKGRLEPGTRIIKVSAPSASGSGAISSRVETLGPGVQEGKRVRQGQVLAKMDSYGRLYAALLQAEAQVEQAQSQLAQVQAGAKSGDINAQAATVTRLQEELQGSVATQKATIARIQAQLRNAELEYQRYESLFQSGAVSASQRDAKRLERDTVQQQFSEAQANLSRTQETLQAQIRESQARLASVAEVRPTDVQQAEAQVRVAIANRDRAQQELDAALVRAPLTGEVVKIHAYAGETVGNDGILELGQTDQMYAVAEVSEADIGRVKVGQTAVITSARGAFSGEITGTVEQVGRKIGRKDALSTNPDADADASVIEVRIRLNNSAMVAGLTNSQIFVRIAAQP